MKSRKILATTLASLVLAAEAALSAGLVTNYASGFFNTNAGYESPYSLDGQPYYPTNPNAWQTTDPMQPPLGTTNIGSTSILQSFAYYTFGDYTTNGNNTVLFGGYNAPIAPPNRLLPGITNPSLYYNFTSSGNLAETTIFSADFAIRRPPGPQGVFTNRDSFGFTLWDTFGTSQIASFMFNGSSPTVAAGTTNYGFQWFNSANVWQSTNAALTATNWQIGLEALYRFNVILSNGGTFNANIQSLQVQTDGNDYITNYAVVQTTTLINGGSLGGYLPGDFSSLSVDWELASGNNLRPGANFMVLNQVNVLSTLSAVIPEPGTWAAGALLAVVTAVAVRRRKRLTAAS